MCLPTSCATRLAFASGPARRSAEPITSPPPSRKSTTSSASNTSMSSYDMIHYSMRSCAIRRRDGDAMANAAGWWVDYKHKLELTVESVLPPKDWWRSPPERKPEPGHVEHAVRVYEQYKLLAGTRDAPHDRLAAIRAWLFKARQLYQMERFAANKTRASRAEALEIARRAGV